MITFRLPLVPSQNQLLRWHWAKRRRLQNKLTAIVRYGMTLPERTMCPITPAAVTITRRAFGKEPDRDNLVASSKLVLDALRDAGVIADDSPEHITLAVQWERAPRGKGEVVATVAAT